MLAGTERLDARIEFVEHDGDMPWLPTGRNEPESGGAQISARTSVRVARRWTAPERSRATEMYLGGESVASVAAHFGIGSTTAWNRLGESDVLLRPRRAEREGGP